MENLSHAYSGREDRRVAAGNHLIGHLKTRMARDIIHIGNVGRTALPMQVTIIATVIDHHTDIAVLV